MIKKLIMIIVAAVLCASCVNEEKPIDLQLNLSEVSLVEGQTVTLSVSVSPSSETASILWRSLDNAVASVDNGIVTAVNPGQTWVSASVGSVEKGCLVTVTEQKILSMDKEVLYMAPDGVQTLSAVYDPALSSDLVWTSSDEAVATVEDGVVTALADGQVKITASIENGRYDTSCIVYVMSSVGNENGDVFIMQGAIGDGSSWDNAGGEDLLRVLLNVRDDSSLSERINGKKIHISEGKYDICKESLLPVEIKSRVSVELLGGYSASLSGSSLEGRAPGVLKSIITVSDGRILTVAGSNINITLDGFVFDRGYAGSQAYGGAIDCSISGKLVLNNCDFTNCMAGYGGGAINVSSGDVHFNNCKFVGNVAGNEVTQWTYPECTGGAVRLVAQSKGYFNNCVFEYNTAHTSADIHVHSAGLAYVNRCSFWKSEITQNAQETYGHGCSITVDATSDSPEAYPTLCILNSTFSETKSNYSKYGGLPVITVLNGNALVCSSTIWDEGMALIKARDYSNSGPLKPDNLWVLNTILANKGNTDNDNKVGVNLVKKSTVNAYCNVIGEGGGAWITLSDLDNALNDTDFDFTGIDGGRRCYEWTLTEGKSITNYAEKSVLEQKVKSACPDFEKWLNEVEADPYGVDQMGNPRNPAKMNPGAWDPYLETADNE